MEKYYDSYKSTTADEMDVSTKNYPSLDDFECVLSNRVDTMLNSRFNSTSIEYLQLESLIVSAANNKDHRRLKDILTPLINEKNTQQLDEVSALHWACYCGNSELVDILLDCGCDPHYPDDINLETPIYFAIKSSNASIVALLLNRCGTSLLLHENRKQMTPFLIAASEFMEDNIISTLHILEYLYLNGVSLEEQDSLGRTALMHSCRRGTLYVVQWLLSRGANLGHRDHLGNTVLHHACHGGDESTIAFLCQKGSISLIDTTAIATTNKEKTPLGICLMKQNYLQYTLLRLWRCQYRICGRMYSLRSLYPVYYWIIAIINLVLYFNMYNELLNTVGDVLLDLWIINWLISQCFWISTFMSDPGIAKKTIIPSQSHVSNSIEQDSMRGAVLKEGVYENMLSVLERRQRMVNYDYYCTNRDSYTMNYWFPQLEYNDPLMEPFNTYYDLQVGLDNPLDNVIQLCREECRNIQLEMSGLYNLVATERQSRLLPIYVESITNCIKQNNIKNVCITCNMVKFKRTHHCGICGHCIMYVYNHNNSPSEVKST